jgi:RNA polymerase sigma-70 factor, ECF subfamily
LNHCEPSKSGEEFTRLLIGHQKRIHGLILALVPNAADAADLLQETCVVLWRKFNEFEPGTDFGAWSLRVARYQVMAYYNRQQRARARFSDETIERLEAQLAQPQWGSSVAAEALAHCLGKLKPRELALIRQRYDGNASVAQMAQSTGATIHAIYKTLNRIHLALWHCTRLQLRKEAEL